MNLSVQPLEVKRYANRKLYVAEQGRYVNVTVLYQTIAGGRPIHVVSGRDNTDITPQMLGIIYQQVCVRQGFVSPETLYNYIRQDGPPFDRAVAEGFAEVECANALAHDAAIA
ncbi:MAG: hypothetical protein EOO38_00235 [Cytophagaceae bacterium]|nr:MAG: hypothetical protein EOO38_00235 [Cytophagaceae bacterium]